MWHHCKSSTATQQEAACLLLTIFSCFQCFHSYLWMSAGQVNFVLIFCPRICVSHKDFVPSLATITSSITSSPLSTAQFLSLHFHLTLPWSSCRFLLFGFKSGFCRGNLFSSNIWTWSIDHAISVWFLYHFKYTGYIHLNYYVHISRSASSWNCLNPFK